VNNVDIERKNEAALSPRRRRRLGVAGMLSVGLLLTACGASDGGGDDAAPAGSEATTPTIAIEDAATPSASELSTPTTDESTDSTDSSGTTEETAESVPASTQAPIPVPTVGPPPPTTVPLPRPVAPPPDDGSRDPEVQLGRLAIPAIGVDSPMFEGIRLPTFDLGPGHWPGSAMPGQIGNMIIGGHRTAANADFRNIDQLGAGDEVIVTTADGTAFTYIVQSTEIVDPFAARVLNQTPEKTATLFACHPPGSIKQRIVAHLTLAA